MLRLAKLNEELTGGINSYRLKHIIEEQTNDYIPNGAVMAGACLSEFPVQRYSDGSPNAKISLEITINRLGRRGGRLFDQDGRC